MNISNYIGGYLHLGMAKTFAEINVKTAAITGAVLGFLCWLLVIPYSYSGYGLYTNRITAQWARVRNAPPNEVMPIATGPNLSIR